MHQRSKNKDMEFPQRRGFLTGKLDLEMKKRLGKCHIRSGDVDHQERNRNSWRVSKCGVPEEH